MTGRFWGFGAFFYSFMFFKLVLADEVLRFGESPIGYVTVFQENVSLEGFAPEPKISFCRQAVGEVSVPTDGLLGLELVGSKIKNANDLPFFPTRTSLLKVSNAELNKEHLAKLGVLGELTRITFEQCKFSENSFDALGYFPELQSCHVTFDDLSPTIEQSFVAWASQQKELQELVVIPQLSCEGMLKLSSLPKLKTIHVSLDANAAATVAALRQMRTLEFLNVVVTDDCPPEVLDMVGELSQLRSYRQVLGKVSSVALTKFAEHGRLERLEVLSVDFDPKSFLDVLKEIKSLKGLDVLTSDGEPLKDLAKACRELPRLTSWPRLQNVSQDDLALIRSRPDTERLSFQYLDSTLKAEDLGELAELKNLKELKIEGISVNDAWLQKLSVLTKLESLDLFDTEVVGHGFAAFAGHKNLRKLMVFVGSYDDVRIDLDLTGLTGTNIESLQIMGPFGQESLNGIGRIKSLRELYLFGDLLGFSDDSITNELSQLPRLQTLHMTGNCFVTDRGAMELSKMDSLQSLLVSGFVSEKGVAALSKIPSLRNLNVASSKIDSEFKLEMPETTVRNFDGNVDEQGLSLDEDHGTSTNGFLRMSKAEGLDKIRTLEGSPPPSVSFTDFGKGAAFKFEDYRGKVILIDFWGTWCGPCRFQMPKLQALYKKYQAEGLEIVSIHTSNGSENLAEYLEKKELPWIHLVDKENATVKSFFVPHYPSLYLVDRAGNVRVALAHPKGLDAAVEKLLSEAP